jgi:hypothetical protein
MSEKALDQDVELNDDNEVVEAHDPKNAETQSVGSVKSAEKAGPTAKPLKGSKKNSEPMPKTKAGMINAAYTKMAGMKKEDLAAALSKFMGEDVEITEDDEELVEKTVDIKLDFSEDLSALVESEATLSEEFKAKTAVIFEAAVKAKLSQEIDRLEEQYAEELQSEIKTTKEDLVEKVDSYLNYVVEQWMEENKLAIQTGLRTEIAETFMTKLKDLFTESYIEVPESKVDLVDELSQANEELEEQFNQAMAKSLDLAEQLETYKRESIIREHSRDLAETQVEKLKSLAEDIDFEDDETFAAKVKTIKESYFTKKSETTTEEVTGAEEGDATEAPATDAMSRYLSAIRKASK